MTENLTKLLTADICDEHGKLCSIVNPIFKLYGGLNYCAGEIATIKLDEEAYHLRLLLNTPGHNRVCVVDAKAIYCAVLGDQLVESAIKNNWQGLIINGYIRDVGILNKMSLPIWALGTCPKRSTKKSPAELEVALEFGGVTFCPGEFVYADQDGILVTKLAFYSAKSSG